MAAELQQSRKSGSKGTRIAATKAIVTNVNGNNITLATISKISRIAIMTIPVAVATVIARRRVLARVTETEALRSSSTSIRLMVVKMKVRWRNSKEKTSVIV
jgi:hypothetical protein